MLVQLVIAVIATMCVHACTDQVALSRPGTGSFYTSSGAYYIQALAKDQSI